MVEFQMSVSLGGWLSVPNHLSHPKHSTPYEEGADDQEKHPPPQIFPHLI